MWCMHSEMKWNGAKAWVWQTNKLKEIEIKKNTRKQILIILLIVFMLGSDEMKLSELAKLQLKDQI